MKKGLKGFLVALVAFGSVSAAGSNNKTYFNTRIGRDHAAAYTTFHELVEKNTDRIGGHLQVTGFYAHSTNDKHLAKNFGADGTDSITVVAPTIAGGRYTSNLQTQRTARQVASNLIWHNSTTPGTLLGTIKFSPKQTVYGARFDYVHRFDKWLVDGLYAAIDLPVVHVENDLNMKVENETGDTDALSLTKVLKGEETAVTNKTALKYSKMKNSSETALGDLKARIGWNFLESSKYHVGINVEGVFPTAEEGDEQFAYRARTGDSKFGLGGGLDASAVIWEEDDENLKLSGSVQYRYLFEGKEKRTLGLKSLKYYGSAQHSTVNDPLLSQHYQIGEVGQTGMEPLANKSTVDCDVQMGSQIDAIASVAYNNGGFTLDAGYNLFWKEAEKVSHRLGSDWDSKYALVQADYDPAVALAEGTTLNEAAADYLKRSDLNEEAAAKQSELVHKVFLAAGYTAKSWEYPVMVGVGVGYELPSNNRDAAEGYSVWVKAGVAF